MPPRTRLVPRLLERRAKLRTRHAAARPATPVARTRPVVMLQLSDHPAMNEAVHAACQLARQQGAMLALVVMVPVTHPGWLGSNLGYAATPLSIERLQRQAMTTAEDYGVDCALTRYQFATWAEGTAQAAELWSASTLIAARPQRRLPGWTRIEAWLLSRQLARQGCIWQEAPFQQKR